MSKVFLSLLVISSKTSSSWALQGPRFSGARQLACAGRGAVGPFYGTQPLQPAQTCAPTGERLRFFPGARQLVRQDGGRLAHFTVRNRCNPPRCAHRLASAYRFLLLLVFLDRFLTGSGGFITEASSSASRAPAGHGALGELGHFGEAQLRDRERGDGPPPRWRSPPGGTA